MSDSASKAVFLSYASQDVEAARRIGESLRSGGIEVWFDADGGLEHGDAWDAKIRRQIKECVLFIPIISANTQARLEGYFRIEWELAAERAMGIAAGVPFILPIGIDGTREPDALVPDRFCKVQWTRVPAGHVPPEVQARMVKLWSHRTGALAHEAARPGPPSQMVHDTVPIRHLAPVDPPAPSRPTPAETKPRIPDYELLRQIGRGSYGDVWLARGATGVWRAIKIVWRERFADAEPFEREWRGLKEFAAISLGESAQMALLHVGRNEEAGFFYYVMELADDAVSGRAIDPSTYVPLTLTQLRARHPRLPAGECVRYGVELARALAGLHRRGLLHRDIKPSNVILVNGVPKLADIGLVAPVADATTFVGTEGFVPPEGPGAPGADVFALGKVLYELATGHDRREFPQLPPDLNRLPDHRALLALNQVILRACEPSADQRYRDAAALLRDLDALQAGRPVARGGRGRFLALAAAAVVVVAAGVWFATRRPAAPAPVAAAVPTPPMVDSPPVGPASPAPRGIAVLPFENLDAADQAFFAAGVTEEVTLQLAKISALRVMSRNAVARFRGGAAELPAMTRELGIGAVLTGTVRHAGDVVRIGVQLLAAPSGETLWAEQYDRPAKDIFGVQSDVAKSVARALQASLAPQERARIERPPTTNTEAYALYFQSGPKPHAEAIDLLKQAIALDPKFALASAALSRRYLYRGYRTGKDDFNRALEAARTAVAIDPQLARGHFVLANSLGVLGRIDEARLAMQRSIELDSNFHTALVDFSVLETNAGRLDQAVYWAKRAFPLAPNIAFTWYHVAGPLLTLDEAVAERWLRAGEARFPANDPTGGYRLQILLALLDFYRGQSAPALQRMRDTAAALPTNGEVQSILTDLALMTGAADAVERVDQALQAGLEGRGGFSGNTPRTTRAFLWMKAGEHQRAAPLIDAALAANRAAIEAGDRSYLPPYENAVLHLMRGDTGAAVEWLERAYTAGFKDAAWLKVDPFIAPLASEPRFTQLADRMKRDVREMRSRVDLSDLDEMAKGGPR